MKRLSLLTVLAAANLFASSFVIPPDLQPGDHFRLVFVTATVFLPRSTNIADFDAVANSQANVGGSLVQGVGMNWLVIGSTASESAATHIGSISVPIYRLDGVRVADSSADLWDGSITNPIQIDQFGNTRLGEVATGSLQDGSAFALHQLGASGNERTGSANATTSDWISRGYRSDPTGTVSLYAISATDFVVPTPAPEPATGALLAGTVGVLLWIRLRSGKKFESIYKRTDETA